MRRQLRWYGASPLHLLALLACFGLAGYAAARLISSRPLAVVVWFLGAVIGHDLVLMPLYSLADRSVMAALRHREPQLPAAPWINYVRVPAALSGLLLLVWFPLILRLRSPYHASTTLSADPYVWHWLAVTGALFLLSAVAFALRLRGQCAPPRRQARRGGPGSDQEEPTRRRAADGGRLPKGSVRTRTAILAWTPATAGRRITRPVPSDPVDQERGQLTRPRSRTSKPDPGRLRIVTGYPALWGEPAPGRRPS